MALVKHGELSNQQISHIQKNLIVFANKDTFWDKFCSHVKCEDGVSAYEWRKLNVKNLTMTDLKDLQEGVTPDGLSLTYVNFKVSPVDFGNYIEYTDKSKKYNYDDVVRDAKTVLSVDAHDQLELRKGRQYISGTCTMSLTTSGDNAFLKDLLKAKTILKKNHIKPINANRYGCIMTPEQAANVLVTYKDAITHTSQKEALIDGYLGELGGFVLYENADAAMYKDATHGYCLFIGRTEYGMPVQVVEFGNASAVVYDNGLGSIPQVDVDEDGKIKSVKGDALHQRGSVGYKAMGLAFRIIADEAVIRAEYTLVQETMTVTDASRNGYQGTATSPSAA